MAIYYNFPMLKLFSWICSFKWAIAGHPSTIFGKVRDQKLKSSQFPSRRPCTWAYQKWNITMVTWPKKGSARENLLNIAKEPFNWQNLVRTAYVVHLRVFLYWFWPSLPLWSVNQLEFKYFGSIFMNKVIKYGICRKKFQVFLFLNVSYQISHFQSKAEKHPNSVFFEN